MKEDVRLYGSLDKGKVGEKTEGVFFSSFICGIFQDSVKRK